jgi:hypothetical protein
VTISGDFGRMPKKCTRMNDEGELPTCMSDGSGGWQVSYPSSGFGDDGGGGLFAFFFALALVAGVAGTLWKVSTARRMARDAGMDERDATTMALLTDEGFEATYLASSLRQRQAGSTDAPSTDPKGTAAERLRELEGLREQGLVSEEEHAAARRAILDSL